jgi:hypothetical protein
MSTDILIPERRHLARLRGAGCLLCFRQKRPANPSGAPDTPPRGNYGGDQAASHPRISFIPPNLRTGTGHGGIIAVAQNRNLLVSSTT